MGQFALGGREGGGAVGPRGVGVLRVGVGGRWGSGLVVGGRGRVVGGDVAEGGVELGC